MIKRNIAYATNARNILDVVYDEGKRNQPVMFFIHGGSWMTGSKDMYTKLGENFLPEGFVTVLISYRLFPECDIYAMIDDCSAALDWCIQNISQYGGDASRIFVMGHSAGGHLAAATGLKRENPKKNIRGMIMVDAFGLSAHHFLSVHGHMVPDFFAGVFGRNSNRWPFASPDKLLKNEVPPFLILTGGGTYPFLAYDNDNFANLLKTWNVKCEQRVYPNKSHMQMIHEFDNIESRLFRETAEWMNATNQ